MHIEQNEQTTTNEQLNEPLLTLLQYVLINLKSKPHKKPFTQPFLLQKKGNIKSNNNLPNRKKHTRLK